MAWGRKNGNGLSGKVVLCVDDEEAVLNALERALRKLDVKIVKALSGAMALAMITGGMVRPDLIVLDLKMPLIDGFGFLRRLPEAFRRAVPVVVLTGDKRDESLMQGYREGADYFMTKPFENRQVVKIVRYLLGDLEKSQRLRLEGGL